MRKLFVLLLLLAVALPVAGCGRKAAPQAPPGTDFPKQYPKE